MSDIADWINDQGWIEDAREQELYAQAKKLEDSKIVKALDGLQDADVCLLSDEFASKVQSICNFYKSRGYITPKQRQCLNSALVQNNQD